MVLVYVAPGRHLLLDGVVTTTYRNTRLLETMLTPGYATVKLVEDKKFYKIAERPVSCCHGGHQTLVPSLWRMAAAWGPMLNHSFAPSQSAHCAKDVGAVPHSAALLALISGATGPRISHCGFRGDSGGSRRGYNPF